MRTHRVATVAVAWALALWLGTASGGARPVPKGADTKGPSSLELSGAEHRLKNFEEQVERAHGQLLKLTYDANQALDRIKKLKEQYPDHPKVEELFQRARKALLAASGKTKELGPEATTYRLNEKKLQAMFFDVAKQEWEKFQKEAAGSKQLIEKPFPAPEHRHVSPDDIVGKVVLLDDFVYPTNQFLELGREFVYVGSGVKGYYFVELSGRPWLGAYEAVKRYRRFINQDVPEGGKWTLAGRITGLELLVPQAGKEKTKGVQWGWSVEPMAIYVPDRTFAWANPHLELGGQFAGEPEMEKIKGTLYTVKSVPDDATPEQVVQTFISAIKEKNYPLYLDCIDPNRRVTPTALSRCLYHWDWHQSRFADLYCHVEVGKAETRVLKGFDPGRGDVKTFFLTEEDKARIAKYAGKLVEEAELKTVAYDERGLQYGSPKPHFLKRIERGRWYITNYPQPF